MPNQGGQAVKAKLAELDAEWSDRKPTLADKPGELRRAEAQYRRVRQRYEAAPRLFVLVGKAELVAGEPMELADTYELRREFVRSRQQQELRRARAAAEQRRRAESVSRVDEHIGEIQEIVAGEGKTASQENAVEE